MKPLELFKIIYINVCILTILSSLSYATIKTTHYSNDKSEYQHKKLLTFQEIYYDPLTKKAIKTPQLPHIQKKTEENKIEFSEMSKRYFK